MGIPVLKIRCSCDRLIFNMGIPIPAIDGLYIEMGPWLFSLPGHQQLWHWVSKIGGPSLPLWRISTKCAIAFLRNDRKGKFIFMFPEIGSAWQGAKKLCNSGMRDVQCLWSPVIRVRIMQCGDFYLCRCQQIDVIMDSCQKRGKQKQTVIIVF